MSSVEQIEVVKGMLREPSISEILKNRKDNHELLGFLTKPGWIEELPYYRFRCTLHGYVENYPQGKNEELTCPHCK